MRGEIDLHGKWVGISTSVMPDKLGFMIHPTKKHFYREMGNKFGAYDHITVRPKSTYDKDNNKIVMWEISSSYFGDKVYLKDSKVLSCILDRNNYSMLDDMFYYRSLKNGGEKKEESTKKKSTSRFGSTSIGGYYTSFDFNADLAFGTYTETLRARARTVNETEESIEQEPVVEPVVEAAGTIQEAANTWFDLNDTFRTYTTIRQNGRVYIDAAGHLNLVRDDAGLPIVNGQNLTTETDG